MFVAGDRDVINGQLAQHSRLARQIALWQVQHPLTLTNSTCIASDDWPYIYLREPSIPMLYFLLALLMVGLVAYGMWRLGTGVAIRSWKRPHWHFFFLGSGFLLLEVQNISKASVVLGNTWLVNAVVISGILVMVLLANLLVTKFPKIDLRLAGACLIGSCLALYFLDLSTFAFLPFASKAILVGLLTTVPMLFSGIIFIHSFARVTERDTALGANLIGALVGGMLQTVTFLTGIKALLLIVAGCYGLALLFSPRAARTLTSSPESRVRRDTMDSLDEADAAARPELVEV
jgi:hypothetical protein